MAYVKKIRRKKCNDKVLLSKLWFSGGEFCLTKSIVHLLYIALIYRSKIQKYNSSVSTSHAVLFNGTVCSYFSACMIFIQWYVNRFLSDSCLLHLTMTPSHPTSRACVAGCSSMCKRTSDSRGLHPSASPPHHPPILPPPPPSPLWHFVQRRRIGGVTAEEETEGTLRQHVPRQSQTARELWFDAK